MFNRLESSIMRSHKSATAQQHVRQDAWSLSIPGRKGSPSEMCVVL